MRDAAGIGVATGAYARSFGAISQAAGFSVAQTSVLSWPCSPGRPSSRWSGWWGREGRRGRAWRPRCSWGREALDGVRLAPLLGVRGLARLGAAHLVIDESTAMATARDEVPAGSASGRRASRSSCAGTRDRRRRPGRERPGRPALARPGRGGARGVPGARRAPSPHRETATVAAIAAWRPRSPPRSPRPVPVLLAAAVAVAAGLRPRTVTADVAGRARGSCGCYILKLAGVSLPQCVLPTARPPDRGVAPGGAPLGAGRDPDLRHRP